MVLPGFLSFAKIHQLADLIQRNGKIPGWVVSERRRKQVVCDLFTICSFLGNKCSGVRTELFKKWMETEFGFIENSQNPLNQMFADFLERDDGNDTRTSDPEYCDLPSTWDQWSLNITVLSMLIKSGAYDTTRGPSRARFNQEHGTEITKDFWERAKEHAQSPHHDRLFVYKKNGRRQLLTEERVLQALIDHDICIPLEGKFYHNHQQYELPPGKTVTKAKKEVTKILRAEVGKQINFNLVNAHWPSSLVIKYKCKSRKCTYCDTRNKIISMLRKEFGLILDPEHLSHRYYSLEKQLKTRITDELGRRRYLTKEEKERLKGLMKELALCDWHFSRNFHQRQWWKKKLQNLDDVSVCVQIDFMKGVKLQQFRGQLGTSADEGTVPFGMTLYFRNPDEDEIMKVDRVLFPNFEDANAYYLIECFKNVLLHDSDPIIQEVVTRMRMLFIMNDTASYLKSGECALYFSWDIKRDFPHLRQTSLVSRVNCHSTMQVDRLFGVLTRALIQWAKGTPLRTRGDLKKALKACLGNREGDGN